MGREKKGASNEKGMLGGLLAAFAVGTGAVFPKWQTRFRRTCTLHPLDINGLCIYEHWRMNCGCPMRYLGVCYFFYFFLKKINRLRTLDQQVAGQGPLGWSFVAWGHKSHVFYISGILVTV